MIQFINGDLPSQDGQYAVFSSSPNIDPRKVHLFEDGHVLWPSYAGGASIIPSIDEFIATYSIIEWIGPIAEPFEVWSE